jgi:amidase
MVPMALGTQTAGSVIRPAAFCGVVGYKPTFGLINRSGVMPFAESLDTVGVFTQRVADAALLTAVVGARPELADLQPRSEGIRLGLCRSPNWERGAPETLALLFDTAERLRARGVVVEEVELPSSFAGLGDAHQLIYAFEGALALVYEHRWHRADLSPRLLDLLDRGADARAADYGTALRVAADCRHAFHRVMSGYDALLTPSTVGEAPEGLDSTGDPTFNRDWTLLHAPCLHLPVGTGPHGMPMGVQLVGDVFTDAHLLSTADVLHRALT